MPLYGKPYVDPTEVLELASWITVQLTPKKSENLARLAQDFKASKYSQMSHSWSLGTPEERFLKSLGMKPDDPNGDSFPLLEAEGLLEMALHPNHYKLRALHSHGLLPANLLEHVA